MDAPEANAVPEAPDIDEAGVDRAQIRAMLRRSPEQRLRRASEFAESLLRLRERNERPPR